jgi:hypothetical protein
MPDSIAPPAIDLTKMSLEQRKNFDAQVAAITPTETPEAKALREKEERDARIEFERKDQVSRAFVLKHADDFQPGEFNAQALARELEGQGWTIANLDAAFVKLAREGKLLPVPYREPVAAPAPPFNYRGLTLKALNAMPRAEYKAKLADPVYGRIIRQIIQDHNEGKASE